MTSRYCVVTLRSLCCGATRRTVRVGLLSPHFRSRSFSAVDGYWRRYGHHTHCIDADTIGRISTGNFTPAQRMTMVMPAANRLCSTDWLIITILRPQLSSGMSVTLPMPWVIYLHTAAGCRPWWRVSGDGYQLAVATAAAMDSSVACSYRTAEHWTDQLCVMRV